MGCSSSKASHSPAVDVTSSAKPDAPMSQAEIDSRIESIAETKTAVFGGIKVRYAYLSQRGYYPDDPNKANQDSYSVNHDFCGQSSDAFFAVFDGHGRDGDGCAQFARDNLAKLVEKHVARAKAKEEKLQSVRSSDSSSVVLAGELQKDQIQTACLKAHVECNKAMHRAPNLDDSLSGTTAVSCFLHGRRTRITICNVGDSRAIVGQQEQEGDAATFRAIPLSHDQTPYRRDERARVKKAGARVLSLDQIEGYEKIPESDEDEDEDTLELGEELDEGGDPPRVWSPNGEYPGTAFTRSLGDSIAEELGVFAEPEMLTRSLSPNDKIIVIATDGVFEFLTNQSVIDMCAKFSDPLQACRAVVAESYELWLQYEFRTDDITMICIFVDGVDQSATFNPMTSFQSLVSEDGDDEEDRVVEGTSRPVRTKLSKQRAESLRKMKIKMTTEEDGDEDMEDFDLSKLYTEKTQEEKERIAQSIRASVMFQNITDDEREMIFGVMESITVKKGTWVIKQGSVGDRFYIVDEGRFEVRIIPEGEEDADGKGGNVVHVYEGSVEKHAHPSFGELALMYSAPRAASIIAQTDGHLWALHRYAFRQVLSQQTGRKELIQTLRRMDAFSKLRSDDIHNAAASMKQVTFGRGETIIAQDKAGDTMYVILSGKCDYKERANGNVVKNSTLKSGDYFGVEVLVDEHSYAATVVALEITCCWKMDKDTLKKSVAGLTRSGRLNTSKTSGNNVA